MLPSVYKKYRIEVFDSLPSTSTYLSELAKKGEPGGATVIAKSQSAGRGRRGRSFFSPEGSGLYMSLLVRREMDIDTSMLLTPAVAVAVCEAIEECNPKKIGIKWVNDIYYEGKKLCGILTETKFDFSRGMLDYAVIGIGINLTPPKEGFPDELKDIVTTLYDECSEELRSSLTLAILDKVEEHINELAERKYVEGYAERSILIGKTVSVIKGEEEYKAVVKGIDNRCRLVVESEAGEERLMSGEVKVTLTRGSESDTI